VSKGKAVKRKKISVKVIYIGIAVAVILLVISTTLFIRKMIEVSQENATVVMVNGEKISVKEFKHFMALNTASIHSYFKQKYGVDDNPKFWTSNYGGEVPLEVARQKTLEDIVRIKVEQILSRDKGFSQDISYNAFLDNLKDENLRRKEAIRDNRAIYGPQEYGVNEYFSYLHSNTLIKLREKLGEEDQELYVPLGKIKEYYEANKDKSYRETGDIKVYKMTVIYLQEDKRKEAAKKAEEIKKRLANGENFEQISKSYISDSSFKYVFEEKLYDKRSARTEGEENPRVFETVSKMSTGEISDLIEEPTSFNVLKCLDRCSDVYQPFEEVKDVVKSSYIDEQFEIFIQRLVKEANVDIEKETFEKISIR
jgi:hypothetical protein